MKDFYEPIVLKNNSSLEDKLNILKAHSRSNAEDIYKLDKGIQGEKQVLYHLTKSNIGMYILRDINFVCDDLKAQIDFIVITSHHCYFIESKNYRAGIIHIDESSNFELSSKNKNHYEKRGIKSPLSQVDDQLSVFQRICLKDQEEVKRLLNGVGFKNYFKTMVVFANPENRLNNKNAPINIKYRVLKVDNLIRQIQYDENHYNGVKLTKNQMLEIANYILSKNVEVTIDTIPEVIEYETETRTTYKKRTKTNSKKVILIISIIIFLILGYFSDNIIGMLDNITNSKVLNDDKVTAIKDLKEKFDSSKLNGFDIYNYDQCIKLAELLPSTFSCNGLPMQVNFTDDNTLTIYKNYYCYHLNYDLENKKVLSVKYNSMVSNSQCPGTDVGFIHYNENNEYLAKIGGYEKILEMARFAHNYSTGFDNYYDYSHVSERGGNPNLSTTYKLKVDGYFGTLTNKGSIHYSNTLNDFNEMIEYYYYIMK